MSLTLALPDDLGAICTDPSDLTTLPAPVTDAHVAVILYGTDTLHIVFDDHVPGLAAAAARVQASNPEDTRTRLLAADLDDVEAAAIGALDVQMVDALSGDPLARRAVRAGYLLVALRQDLRTSAEDP